MAAAATMMSRLGRRVALPAPPPAPPAPPPRAALPTVAVLAAFAFAACTAALVATFTLAAVLSAAVLAPGGRPTNLGRRRRCRRGVAEQKPEQHAQRRRLPGVPHGLRTDGDASGYLWLSGMLRGDHWRGQADSGRQPRTQATPFEGM